MEIYWTPWFEDITPTMANTHLVYPDLVIDKFSVTDPDQDSAKTFIQIIERKINFVFGDAPGNAGELANYTFRKKTLFSSLLRRPGDDYYESNHTNATTWEKVRTSFITLFLDGPNKFGFGMEVKHCIGGDGEDTVSSKRLKEGGLMIWTVLRLLNKMQNERLKDDKEDRDISTTR